MSLLDSTQRQRAVEAMQDYLSAPAEPNGKTPWEIDAEFDQTRQELIETKLKPLLQSYFSGCITLSDFKSQVDGFNKRFEYWGFKGIKGQMFFNMVVNNASDLAECNQKLATAIKVPNSVEAAANQIREFASYINKLGNDLVENGGSKHGKPKIGSIPFFLSYFWQIQDNRTWPIYYTHDTQALEDLDLWRKSDDLAENYITFHQIIHELARFLTETSGRECGLYNVEHLLWYQDDTAPTSETAGPEVKTGKTIVVDHKSAMASDRKLPDSYVPPIVAMLPLMALNNDALAEAAKRSGISLERAFEKSIHAAFTIIGYDTQLLGQGQGRVPDGRAVNVDASYAILWDGKIRVAGYTMGTDDRTIRDYVMSQSRDLKKRNSLRNIYYVLVSSGFQDDYDDLIRSLKMETDVNEVILMEAEALVAMVDMKLRNPHQVTLGPDGLQRLFTSSGILSAEDVSKMLA